MLCGLVSVKMKVFGCILPVFEQSQERRITTKEMIVGVGMNDGECGSFVVTKLVKIFCIESIPEFK
jgi:hypothetical protein